MADVIITGTPAAQKTRLDTLLGALAVYANNAAAKVGGLTTGDHYRTGADPDVVCVVHA
jgi:hypothetical protein